MNVVTAEIDVTTPTGRKLVKELERKRCVKLTFPNVVDGVTYSHKEVWEKMENKLNQFYGTDHKLKLGV